MTQFSYHASHEQFPPSVLLRWVCHAEAAGFDAAFSSDHLQPWTPQQGHAGFSWSWLGAVLHATRRLSVSTITIPGGWRYSPVVLAQAAATLAEMFPGRLPWIALGSGEAVNEAVVSDDWPAKGERLSRLAEGAIAMRRLLAGETVSRSQPPLLNGARLWVRPAQVPQLVGAAVSHETAREVARWADGLLTVAPDVEGYRQRIDAFRDGGGDGKPVHFKVDLCWAPTQAAAEREALAQWRQAALDGPALAELRQPEAFEAAVRTVSLDDVRRQVFVSASLAEHTERLRALMALGPATIDLHQVGPRQAEFIDAFGREVLPALRG